MHLAVAPAGQEAELDGAGVLGTTTAFFGEVTETVEAVVDSYFKYAAYQFVAISFCAVARGSAPEQTKL